MSERFASKQELIKSAYKKIFMASIFVLLATNIGMIVDNIVVGRLLGTNGLAAIGFFAPISTAVGFSYIIISGAGVICGNFWARVKETIYTHFLFLLFLLYLSFQLSLLYFVLYSEHLWQHFWGQREKYIQNCVNIWQAICQALFLRFCAPFSWDL